MQVPLQVSFKGMPVDDAMQAACLREAEKLERYFDRITSCRVTVAQAQRLHRNGNHYDIRTFLALPHGDVVVDHEPAQHRADEKPELALREAFDEARRGLEDYVRRTHGRVKGHAEPEHGTVAEVWPQEGYGVIRSSDGDELYFHRNSFVQGSFDELQLGTEVRFVSEQGDEGPQATGVRVVGRHHHLSP